MMQFFTELQNKMWEMLIILRCQEDNPNPIFFLKSFVANKKCWNIFHEKKKGKRKTQKRLRANWCEGKLLKRKKKFHRWILWKIMQKRRKNNLFAWAFFISREKLMLSKGCATLSFVVNVMLATMKLRRNSLEETLGKIAYDSI